MRNFMSASTVFEFEWHFQCRRILFGLVITSKGARTEFIVIWKASRYHINIVRRRKNIINCLPIHTILTTQPSAFVCEFFTVANVNFVAGKSSANKKYVNFSISSFRILSTDKRTENNQSWLVILSAFSTTKWLKKYWSKVLKNVSPRK